MGDDLLAEMNLLILRLSESNKGNEKDDQDPPDDPTHKGNLLMDATAAPQEIAYPTDLNLLNRSREITEKIIDFLHVVGEKKVRTYRKNARKEYLKVAQNRRPSRKTIRKRDRKAAPFS